MLCSAPSSVTVKSFAVRPSTGLPLLSFTFTVSTTNWLLVENVDGPAPAGAFWPICWASKGRAPPRTNKSRTNMARGISLEPHYEPYRHTAHRIGCCRKTELRAAKRGVPTRERDVVDRVRRINPQVAAQPVAQSKRASSRGIQCELKGPRDGIPSGIAPLARLRSRVCRGIQVQSWRSIVYGHAGIFRTKRTHDAGALCRRKIQRRERQPAAGRDCCTQHPSLEQRAPPTVQQRSAGRSHAGGVLNRRAHKMPLIETGEASLRAQVQPILGDREIACAGRACRRAGSRGCHLCACGSSSASQNRVIVDGLCVGILDRRREAAMQAAAQLDLS